MADQPSENLDLEIKQLERDKKLEEVRQLKSSRKAAWIAPAALAALVPIAVAFGGFAWKEFKDYNEGYKALAEIERVRAQTKDLQAQKDSLNTEVVALAALRQSYADLARETQGKLDGLQAKFDSRQKQLDETYVRIRFANSEAKYALDHIDLERGRAEHRSFTGRLAAMPSDVSKGLNDAVRDWGLALEMIEASKEMLSASDGALGVIPASEWVFKLAYYPSGGIIPNRKIVISSEGQQERYFDVDEGRFLLAEEVKNLKP